jgi:hypothetical protein
MKLFRRVALVVLFTAAARAAEPPTIEGVQPAALDQPRIFMNFRRSAKEGPLTTKAEPSKKKQDIFGDIEDSGPKMGAEAFLDTGASGVVLSSDTAQQLGIALQKARDGQNVKFEDAGVAGSESFNVTEPLFAALAPYPKSDSENPASYAAPIGPIRAQVRGKGGILELLAPGMDIAGMPVMQGKVIVIDPKPLAQFDKLHTIVVPAGDKRIPQTTLHVPLTYVSFAKFTRTTPAGATRPTQLGNPMIGPDPFASPPSKKQAVQVTYRGKSVTGTFLLDTGAASSLISSRLASQLGIDFAHGTKADFKLAIGGLGGQKDSSGVFVDRVALPTMEGPPIVYAKAPLLVTDVSVADEKGDTFTLDGVIGMNYLVASAEVTGGLLPDIGKIIDGPYSWIVIDHVKGQMGLVQR